MAGDVHGLQAQEGWAPLVDRVRATRPDEIVERDF